MRKEVLKKWLLGMIMTLVCFMAVSVGAKAAYELDGRCFGTSTGYYMEFHKAGSEYLVIYREPGETESVWLRWRPTKTKSQYSGALVSATTESYAAYAWINVTNSSLLVKSDTGVRAYVDLKLTIPGSGNYRAKGYMYDKTSLKITGATTLWSSGSGKTVTLKAVYGGKAKTATWTSSNKKIATVSKSGKVTAKKAGKVKITAKVNGKKTTVTINVKKPTIKLSKKTATVKAGTTLKLGTKVTGYSQKISWKSSKKSVATVNAQGVITAKKKGTATITATANGVKATFKIKVKK